MNKITPENYYEELGKLNNHPKLVMIDIVTFTGFMNWEEKVAHYNRYLEVINND